MKVLASSYEGIWAAGAILCHSGPTHSDYEVSDVCCAFKAAAKSELGIKMTFDESELLLVKVPKRARITDFPFWSMM